MFCFALKAAVRKHSGVFTIPAVLALLGPAAGSVPAEDILLPAPIVFEDFNQVPEGVVPTGWQAVNYSQVSQNPPSLHDLNSVSYAGWLVVESARFRSNFVGYTSHTPVDYSRVLSFNPDNVVNGRPVTNLAEGRMLFSTSGYREGSQVMFLQTRDFDLSGRTNVYLSFHSLWEQNQDNFAAVEYSIDRGTNWLPIAYFLDAADIISAGGGVDAVRTFNTRRDDVAVYRDPVTQTQKGGYYGAFIGAPVTPALAPFISGRVDDNPVESKRVELYRLPAADNQATVRFRVAHAGTDSWYWGIDNFGLYSITPGLLPVITATPRDASGPPGLPASFTVRAEGVEPLSYQWKFSGTNLPGATNATLVLSGVSSQNQGLYVVIVSNPHGSIEVGPVRLTLTEPKVTGQWDFEHGDLRATAGEDLELAEAAGSVAFLSVDMPGYPGPAARVVQLENAIGSRGFYVRHGALPNAGGRFVNRYTLLMDVLYPQESDGKWRALFQTDPFNHAGNDAEFYAGDHTVLPEPGGIGAEGLYHGPLAPGLWHRIAFAVDLAAPDGLQLTKYIDGVRAGSQSLSGGIDGRFALGPAALLFATGVDPEARLPRAWVNSIQFVDDWLSAEAVAAVGPAKPEGLPPGDAAVKLESAAVEGASVFLQWSGPPGTFEVLQATRLENPDWQVVAGPISNHNVILPLLLDASFYRVRQARADLVVGQLGGGAQSLPTKQILRPVGAQLQFAGRPVDLALSPDRSTVYLKNINNLLVVDAAAWRIRQTLSYPGAGASMHGIAVAHDGRSVFVTGSGNQLFEWRLGADGMLGFARTVALPTGSYPCGIALSRDGNTAYVCLSISNSLAVVDLASGSIRARIPVGIAPWDVVLSPDETTAFVSDWGGRVPGKDDLTAPSAGTPVVVDERGVAASGVVSIVNLNTRREESQVPTGLHPCDLKLSAEGDTLYVANANSDTVTVIDTRTRAVRETILIRPEVTLPYGSASTGLALSADGKSLYVASAGNNAVAVVALGQGGQASEVRSFLPTDWYPGAVAVDGTNLYVVNVKGLGTRLGQPNVRNWQIGAHLGTALKLGLPDQEALNKLTAQAFEDGRVPHIKRAHLPARPDVRPVPVPHRLGEPSVFKHVLYILKENKTYDQLFGDMPEGNGDPSLCIYPEFVTPNHHALAREYVLLDNFYCNGVNSSDGHSWSTEANVTDHLEKSFGGFTRSYSFGDDPLTYSSSGFIWNNVLSHGLTFRNYGEMDYASPAPQASWLQIYQDFTNGTRSIRYVQNIGIESLRRYSSTNVPGWNMEIPDAVRADGFLREFRQAEARGTWEHFSLLYLPNDHTGGSPSPRAQMADNDLALGQVVQAVTSSRFASNTVIFVIEDDPQSGYDHVDAHRSICLVISPYTKRRQVISTFYNQAGVLHTMERILGLPPMNQQDAMAPIMFGCFTTTPDFTPYRARANNIPLAEGATRKAMLNPKDRYWAEQLRTMDLSKPDRIDDDLFNRYIWYANKGDVPYPSEFAGAHGKGLKQLGLVLEGGD